MSAAVAAQKQYHIIVTVLQFRLLSLPRFAWFAAPIPGQAARSPGNVRTETRIYPDGRSYTLTAWESRHHMLAFMRSGAHGRAMRHLRAIASYAKTYSCDRADIPSLAEAIRLIDTEGRFVFDHRPPKDGARSARLYAAAAAAVALAAGFGYWATALSGSGRGGTALAAA